MKEQWSAQQRWDAFKAKMMTANRRQHTSAESAAKFSATLNAIKY